MAVLLKLLKGFCYFFLIISCICIALLAIWTVYDVIMRFLFNRPNSGLPEWSQVLLIVSIVCMGFAVADGRATRVDVLVNKFPKNLNIAFEIIMGLAGFVFFALCGWRLLAQIESSINRGEAYFFIGFPRWPCYGALGFAFLSSAVGSVHFTIKSVVDFKAPKARGSLVDDPELAILADMDAESNKGHSPEARNAIEKGAE